MVHLSGECGLFLQGYCGTYLTEAQLLRKVRYLQYVRKLIGAILRHGRVTFELAKV